MTHFAPTLRKMCEAKANDKADYSIINYVIRMSENEEIPWWTPEELQQELEALDIHYQLYPPPLVDWHLEQASTYTGANIEYKYLDGEF
jgi:hypothetical protein